MHPADSHPTDLLRYGHPRWVHTLSRGAGLAWWGLALGAAAVVAGEAFPRALAAVQPWRLAEAAGSACVMYGAWLLAAKDRNGSPRAAGGMTRLAMCLALAAGVLAPLVEAGVAKGPGGSRVLFMMSAAAFLAGAVDIAGRLALLQVLRRLALRLPDAPLSKRIGSMAPAYGAALASFAVVDALRALPVLRHLGLAAAVASAVLTYLILRLVARVGRGLVIQTDYARGLATRGKSIRVAPHAVAA